MTLPAIPLRPTLVSTYGAVAVTPHHASTQAAISMIDRGGNAVDAAIAANAVQGVVAPETCGIGGDLFALVLPAGETRPDALNASGRAGSGADGLVEGLRRSGENHIPQRHPGALTIPGCVDGWATLHERHGYLDWGSLFEPAIRVARDGFPASREMAAAFARRQDELCDEASARDMYPAGSPPLEGTRIVRRDLVATLERVATDGRDGFYAGVIGAALSRATGGTVTVDDLARQQADWVVPLSAHLFGHTGWTIPPNSQGYIALLALRVIELLGPGDLHDPATWHVAIEACRLAAADRSEVCSDPSTLEHDPDSLVATERAVRLAERIDLNQAARTMPDAKALGGTAYLCVVDREGMGISLIQSNYHGIGSGVSVEGAGFLLQDRGRGFSLEPDHPNELRSGRRPLHTLSPTMWTDSEGLNGIIGTRGGDAQPQLIVQLGLYIMGRNLDPASAMALPRWQVSTLDGAGSGHLVKVEPGTPDHVVDGLGQRGHDVQRLDYPQPGWGPMAAIRIARGLRSAASDPRVDTSSAAAV